MANFPFIVQPRLKPIIERIGSEDAGYIEIKRQGYLSVGERAGTRQIMSAYDVTSDVIALSKRVGAEKKMDLQAAYEAVSAAITGEGEKEIADEYKEEITALLAKLTQSQVYAEMAKSFSLLLYRVEGAEELTMDDVAMMHPDLLEGLAALYDEEEAKSTERLLEGEEKRVEDVEKAAGK